MTETLQTTLEAPLLDVASLGEDVQQLIARLARRALRGRQFAVEHLDTNEVLESLYAKGLDDDAEIRARRLGIQAIAAEALQ